MKFGSRMDVFVPRSATLAVRAGDRVIAGVTRLAELAAVRSRPDARREDANVTVGAEA
jgi:hypothetical protein